jgi:disulfide bond formation protein DsbB
MKAIPESALAATLDRLILSLMLLALAGVLTAAMGFQYLAGEIPCPLCLLERVAMFACCFGLIRQLRDGGSQRGAGVAMISAVLLLVISVRQTLLDIVPRPGHAYIGAAVFGLHMAGMVRAHRDRAADRLRCSSGGSWRPELGGPSGIIHASAAEHRSWTLRGDTLRDQLHLRARSVRLWPMPHDGICVAALTGRPRICGLFASL